MSFFSSDLRAKDGKRGFRLLQLPESRTLVPCRPKLGHQDLENIGTVSQNHSVCLISLPTKHAGGHKVSSLGGKGGLQWNERFSRVTENWWLSPRSLSGTNLCSYFVRKLSLQKYFFHWDSLSLWQTWSVSSNIRNEILFHTETEILDFPTKTLWYTNNIYL